MHAHNSLTYTCVSSRQAEHHVNILWNMLTHTQALSDTPAHSLTFMSMHTHTLLLSEGNMQILWPLLECYWVTGLSPGLLRDSRGRVSEEASPGASSLGRLRYFLAENHGRLQEGE